MSLPVRNQRKYEGVYIDVHNRIFYLQFLYWETIKHLFVKKMFYAADNKILRRKYRSVHKRT